MASSIGLRAFMRWRFDATGQDVRAVRAVDTATHPDHQGRGIFSRLTSEAIDLLRGDTDLIFNTPNEKSLPGYLKLGWRIVGRAPVLLRIKRPLRLLRNLSSVRNTTVERPMDRDRSGHLGCVDRRLVRSTSICSWRRISLNPV